MVSIGTPIPGPPLFSGVFFVLCGFDAPTQTQISAALEEHGGVNVGEYNSSCTHVIVSRTFLWDDPVCAAARKDGKCLCTELWVSDCLDIGIITDVNHVIYRPLRDSQGIIGSKNFVVCLTGYQGQARRNVMRMVHLMGANFSKPLVAHKITHLVCYKFEGEKFNLAKQLRIKLINHQWLEDCLRTWALLSEEDYTKSGFELELAEAEAKDSEDDTNLKAASSPLKVPITTLSAPVEGVRQELLQVGDIQEQRSDDGCLPTKQTPSRVDDVGLPIALTMTPSRTLNSSLKKRLASMHVDEVDGNGTRDGLICKLIVEGRNTELTPQVKRTKANCFPELASSSQRQSITLTAEENCYVKHGSEIGLTDEVLSKTQHEQAQLGSSFDTHSLTTPAKQKQSVSRMDVQSTSLGLKNDSTGTISPSARSTCHVRVCQGELGSISLIQDTMTPSTLNGKEHDSGKFELLMSDRGNQGLEGLDNAQKGTPVVAARTSSMDTASVPSKKSMGAKRLAKTSSRNSSCSRKSKVHLSIGNNPSHSTPKPLSTKPALPSTPHESVKKPVVNSMEPNLCAKGSDKQKAVFDERNTIGGDAMEVQLKETEPLVENKHIKEVLPSEKSGQSVHKDVKVISAKKQGKALKQPDLKGSKVRNQSPEKMVAEKENALIECSKSEKQHVHQALQTRKLTGMIACADRAASIHRCFALSGRKHEIKPLQACVKKLGGKLCRDSHQWSHQTTHLVIAGQLRRTEKFFAAAAAGRWILQDDYLKHSSEASMFLDEKKYEWHKTGITADGSISFEAPRKWRELRESTGHCALEGLRIVLYGECIIPSLDTLRRGLRAGGADLVATSPPYTRFLASRVDLAIVNPGTPKNDPWIQEFLKHDLACVTTDFFVDYVCKPSSCLDRHVLYDTHQRVETILERLREDGSGVKACDDGGEDNEGDIWCAVCGRSDREDVMLLCGDDNGSGCGIAMHIDCCTPPLDEVPAQDWYCPQCTKPQKKRKKAKASRKG